MKKIIGDPQAGRRNTSSDNLKKSQVREKTLFRVVLLIALGVLNVVLFTRMVWGPSGLVEYHSVKNMHVELDNRISQLDKANARLSREIRLLQTDNAFTEKMIRQHLHFLRDGEIIYLFDESEPGVDPHDGKN